MFPSAGLVSRSAGSAFPASFRSALPRSSRRSRSGAVVALSFSSFGAAASVACFWSARLPAGSAPRVRRVGSLWSVSVPVVL